MRFFIVPAFLISLVGMSSVVAIQSLDKRDMLNGARYDLAVRPENFGALALVFSPLIGNFLLTAIWRNRHPFAGFMLAVIISAVSAWGTLVDWLFWRDSGAPEDPTKFQAAFYTTWICWGLVLAFALTGLILKISKTTPASETARV